MTETKTYVLVGAGREGELPYWQARGDCIIIQPKPGESIKDVARSIQGPANIILNCDGGEGGIFAWHDHEKKHPRYADFFRALPREGIVSITLATCYGGTAQTSTILAAAPPGCLVQSTVGKYSLSNENFVDEFATESKGLHKPVDLFLKVIDNFDPLEYKAYVERWNKKGWPGNPNPDHALPHILGIGGEPPLMIDLDIEAARLAHPDTAHTRNEAAWHTALVRVQVAFDTKNKRGIPENMPTIPGVNCIVGGLGDAEEKALHTHIAAVAKKMEHGWTPKDEKTKKRPLTIEEVEEKRIAYAITAAYMEESGALRRMVHQCSLHRDANGQPIEASAVSHALFGAKQFVNEHVLHTASPANPNITQEEHFYLGSVRTALQKDHVAAKEVDAIIAQLTSALAATPKNDSFKAGSALDKQLHAHHISTQTWTR